MTTPARILVVDDDNEMRLLLKRCFDMEGYEVVEARDGKEVRQVLAAGGIDLMTLDLKLGVEDGLELAREVRSRQNIPIIMVTGKSDPIDRIVGLELGADDYIVKPFHLREVLARVRAVLRRYAGPEIKPPSEASETAGGSRLAFEGFVLDQRKREVVHAQRGLISLTTAEYNMLELLALRPHRVLSRDNLMDLLKGHEWSPFDRSIDTLIGRLRRKVEADSDAPRLIKTVRGVGYVFTADVVVQ